MVSSGIRHLLLAHKLLLTVHLYHARVHSPKTAASPGARYAVVRASNGMVLLIIMHQLGYYVCVFLKVAGERVLVFVVVNGISLQMRSRSSSDEVRE